MTTLGELISDPASGLAYRLRMPAPAAARGLLLMLHGVGGQESNLAALPDGLDPQLLVAFVRAPHVMGPGQYGWFPVVFTPTGPSIDAPAAEDSRERLVRLVAALQQQYTVSRSRTVIAGFSQGGIMSASVGLSAPERVAGFGLLSGRILPELEPTLAPREALATLSAFVGHGRDDDKLPVAWAQKADRWLDALGVPHELHTYDGGHGIGAPMAADFRRWLERTLGA